MAPLLGCIADDFTGASDLAGMLVKFGMRTVLVLDGPADATPGDADAIVVALKSRTTPVREAVDASLGALNWLRRARCRQFYIKYCSTFDSTPDGNIGPVVEAVMQALGTDFTIACPAFPDNRRTVYQGHLFVGSDLLSDSGMRDHPLTPMADSNLLRVLGAQTKRRVGLVDLDTVRKGPAAVRDRIIALGDEGIGLAITDAVANEDLDCLARACAGLTLLTGGSGLARGVPEGFRRAGLLPERPHADALPETRDTRAVIAGSCSVATRGQVAALSATRDSLCLDEDMLRSRKAESHAIQWARGRIGREPILVYTTAEPEEVRSLQARHDGIGSLIEDTLAAIARHLVDELGVRRLVVAGGETSGAVVRALGVQQLLIGPEICPGVPWTVGRTRDGSPMALALKSGNFGAPHFFLTAWNALERESPAPSNAK